MFQRILHSQTKTITFAAIILAFSAFVSRILGLIRDRLLAGNFGASAELDIYFAAFRIPDFVYGIFIAGGIIIAFLPVLSEYFEKYKQDYRDSQWPKEVSDFVSNALNCILLVLIVMCGILALLTPFIIRFVIPGFSAEHKELAVSLTRIMFLSPIFFGLSSIFSGILHYFDRFLAYSLAPIMYNLGIIFGIVVLVPIFGIYGLVYGVILGAFCHLFVQIPSAIKSGFSYRPFFNFKCQGLRKILKLVAPKTIGAAAYQINLIVITAIASTLSLGSITIFNFSNNLQYIPVGIIGISFAVSSFPVFSRTWANNDKNKYLEHFSSSFRQIAFFIIPVSIAIFLLRAQIVRLVLGTGQYGWTETRLTAACLGLFCFGIFAAGLVPLLNRAFFALKDVKTPVSIAIVSMTGNIIFAFLFVYFLKFPNIFKSFFVSFLKLQNIPNIEVIGLPLALSLACIIQFFLLLIFFYKKIGDFRIKEIYRSLKKILFASILLAVFIYFVLYIAAGLVDMQTFWGVLLQAVSAGTAGAVIYLAIVFILKSPELGIIKHSVFKQFKETTEIDEPGRV